MNRILKARIIEKYGTQSDFSEVIKTNETIISKIIRNRRKLSPEAQKLWSKALGCKPGELFSEGG